MGDHLCFGLGVSVFEDQRSDPALLTRRFGDGAGVKALAFDAGQDRVQVSLVCPAILKSQAVLADITGPMHPV